MILVEKCKKMGRIILKKASSSFFSNENFSLDIWGYVLPRLNEDDKDIVSLYTHYGIDFIKHIKGHFIIKIIEKNGYTHLFTDHIGIKKLFYWQNESEYIISDNIGDVVKEISPKISTLSIALHSLFHHFIGERTIYENVYYSKPASHFIISPEGKFSIEQYWNYEELLKLPSFMRSYNEFSELFKNLTKEYLNLTNEKVTMTLTGGMDSRIVLGSLLENNHHPFTFTFGDKLSADVYTSSKITKVFNLEYHIHDFPKPETEWYENLSKEIIELGHGMVHIHRSHRLDAIKREKKLHPETNMVFLGSMGGEGVRGLHYDDLITTSFVRRIYETNESLDNLIEEYLQKYFLNLSTLNVEELKVIIKKQDFIKNDYKINQFFLLYQLVASLHDTQDIQLYNQYYDYVICPFLDIDYLELLFSSQHHLLNKNATSHKIKDRLIIPEFHVNVSNLINKDLSKFQYSNGFSPQEYLYGKYLYLIIRGVRKKFRKKFPPNFPYSSWYINFVHSQLSDLDEEVNKYFVVEKAKDLIDYPHETIEGYWHRFSNIIMTDMILKNKNRIK